MGVKWSVYRKYKKQLSVYVQGKKRYQLQCKEGHIKNEKMQQIIKNQTMGNFKWYNWEFVSICSQKGTLRVTEEGKGKMKSVFEGHHYF